MSVRNWSAQRAGFLVKLKLVLALAAVLLLNCGPGNDEQDTAIDDLSTMGEHGSFQDCPADLQPETGDFSENLADAALDVQVDAWCQKKVYYFVDQDGDGYPLHSADSGDWFALCSGEPGPHGYAAEHPSGWDCDDSSDAAHPDAVEFCDHLDNDCDGEVDEGVLVFSYADQDQDGFGGGEAAVSCTKPPGHVLNKSDCDDNDPNLHPGAPELCDGSDNDCDDLVDEGLGVGDECFEGLGLCMAIGQIACGPDLQPYCTAPELASSPEICDWMDNDCDGQVDEALTQELLCGESDVWACTLGASYQYCVEGQYTSWTLCDAVVPAAEICDGVDNDCDGETDEELTQSKPCGDSNVGECKYGVAHNYCLSGKPTNWQDCDAILSAAEVCDGKDNDCDGMTDEGLALIFFKDFDGDSFGNPFAPTQACTQPQGFVPIGGDCDDYDEMVNPAANEICDGIDNDCDGDIDWGWECCEVGGVADASYCPPADMIFVTDNSGSMDDNDPSGIRYLGLKGFVDKLKPGDRGMVVPFGEWADEMGPFSADKSTLKAQVNSAQVAYVGLKTKIGHALMKVGYPAFEAVGQERTLILFTDGYTGDVDEAAYPPGQLAAAAKNKGVAVYAIGLGDDVNHEYLTTLSDGKYVPVSTAADILKVYDKLFAVASQASWKECSPEHEWVSKIGHCGDLCDDGLAPRFFWRDMDNDGHGKLVDVDSITVGCEPPDGYADNQDDCDDLLATTYPGALELCDDADNDCDSIKDEDLTQPCYATGGCVMGFETCKNGVWKDCDAPVLAPDLCDGLDNDCDGLVDEETDPVCSTACGSGQAWCTAGLYSCDAPQPTAELQDGQDNDCDGIVDEIDCWEATHGGPLDDSVSAVWPTIDGGFVVAGITGVSTYGSHGDFWVFKTDGIGKMEWEQAVGGNDTDEAKAVVQLGDGLFAAAGHTFSKGAGKSDMWVVLLDQQGTVISDRLLGGTQYDKATGLTPTPDGGMVVVGLTNSMGAGSYDAWIVKLDAKLNTEWELLQGKTGDDAAHSVERLDTGGYIVAGKQEQLYEDDIWVAELTDSGAVEWTATYDVNGDDVAFEISQISSGGYLLVGRTSKYSWSYDDAVAMRISSNGSLIWSRILGASYADTGWAGIEVTNPQTGQPDGFAVGGQLGRGYYAGDDFWLARLNANGEAVWENTYGTYWDDEAAYTLRQTASFGFILAGYTDGKGAGKGDAWLLHLDYNGNLECP